MSRLYIYPPTPVSVSIPAIQFDLDGVTTTVSMDTVTPGNSTPLPSILLDQNGDPVDFSGLAAIGPVGKILLDFSATNVTDVAYVQILASSPLTKKIQVFMSSGEPLYLAFGAAASEVDQAFIIPGGNGLIDFEIPAGTRLSVKAVGSGVTVNSGLLLINLLG